MLTGKVFSLLITKDIEIKAITKKDKITIPNALKLVFKFKVCFVDFGQHLGMILVESS